MRSSITLPLIAAVLVLASAAAQARVSHGYSTTFSLDTVTAVSDEVSHPPQATMLASIFPNPFNPRTTIAFEMADAGSIELAIFDLRGRLIRLVVSGFQSPGRYQATWDGCNDLGRPMATGTYFCRLKAAQMSQIKKLMLVR